MTQSWKVQLGFLREGCHPGGPWQPWGVGTYESHEIQLGRVQGLAVESQQSPISLQTGGWMYGEQPWGVRLGHTGGENLDTSWQWSPSEQKANCITPVSSSVIFPLYSPLVRPPPEYSIHLWDPQYRKGMNGPARVDPEKGHKNYQKAGAPLLWRKAELRSLNLEKRGLHGDLRSAFQYTRGAFKETEHFTRACQKFPPTQVALWFCFNMKLP